MCPCWSEPFWRYLEKFIACAVRRGINAILTPIHTPPLDTAEGGERMTSQLVDVYLTRGAYSFGFDKLRRFVDICKRCGVRYYEMAHLFTQWGARFAPKIIVNVDGQERKLFGWHVSATIARIQRIPERIPARAQGRTQEPGRAGRDDMAHIRRTFV